MKDKIEIKDKINYIYIVECNDGTLYTGWTTDIAKRIKNHNCGKGAKYTRIRCPVILKHIEKFDNKKSALKREREIKKLSRIQKLKLISIWRKSD